MSYRNLFTNNPTDFMNEQGYQAIVNVNTGSYWNNFPQVLVIDVEDLARTTILQLFVASYRDFAAFYKFHSLLTLKKKKKQKT